MSIPVTNPVVAPATDAVTYNTFWLQNLSVQANDPMKPVRVMATVAKMNVNGSTSTLAPQGLAKGRGSIVIPDLYASAATDAVTVTLPSTLGGAGPAATLSLADIMQALLLKTCSLAEAQNVI